MMRNSVVAAALIMWGLSASEALTQTTEPAWSGPIIARGELRAEIESTPILERSYRPLHFYGNTVRRRFYRGTAMPVPQDMVQAATTLLFPNR